MIVWLGQLDQFLEIDLIALQLGKNPVAFFSLKSVCLVEWDHGDQRERLREAGEFLSGAAV